MDEIAKIEALKKEAKKSEKTSKIRAYIEKILMFIIIFLVIFIALFYIVNLDFSSNKNQKEVIQNSDQSLSMDEQVKKLTGSTDFGSAGYDDWTKANDLTISKDPNLDPDKDGLPNYLEYIYGTDPLNADTDGDVFTDKQEIANGYDPDAFGDAKPIVEITISKINVVAPMIWSTNADETAMLKDLESGVSHYPKSAASGQNGNMVISGHSSNYFWAKGDYNHIFKDLNNLEKGDIIVIKTLQKNGKVIIYKYTVTDKFVTAPNDEKIFAPTNDPVLTLSTCWPIGTNLKRLIVKTELVK